MINDANIIPIDRVPAYTRAIKIGNRVFPLAVYSNTSGGTSFYRCASVDTSAKTWTGYKAVLADGVYSFEETVTEGLSYENNFPLPAQAYTSDLSVTVKELQSKDIADISGGEVIGERYVVADAKTLATGYFEYRKLNSGWSLMWHVITHGWDRDYYHIIAVGLTADAVRMDASGYKYDPVEFTVDGDSRTWYYCKSQGVGANDGFNPIFNGKPIDVGSNGEDYLAQAKELLNNYLAGTIIGESLDTGDKPYAYTVTKAPNGYEDAIGDYYPATAEEMMSLYPQTGSYAGGQYYTNGNGWALMISEGMWEWTINKYYPDYGGGDYWKWENYAMCTSSTLPDTGNWMSGYDVVEYVGKDYKYTVSGFTGETEAANGDYYEVNPDNVYSTILRESGIYYNGTYYLCNVNDGWYGWAFLKDITVDPVSATSRIERPAMSTSAETPDKADWSQYGGSYDYKIVPYAK